MVESSIVEKSWVKKEAADKALYFLLSFVVCALMFIPGLCFADSPFANATQSGQTDILTIITPIVGVGVMVVGLLCLFGKISWWWFIGVVIGIILVFGHEQIISWIRGLAGV
ncbi:TrbC/VirB2 family protein [Salmonella enterica subsp. enterica serovar Ealing]|jgi:type IV secretion system protein VirB2|nr:TrbC/VirB2 family protein [Salmonella enterica]EIM5291254.1 TrbC/VirB2 family protein [Salmonella enterica subsp. enterica serovar Ealing]EJQ0414109.1 TrbC/VirB2 family protein [Escherichia coli]EGL5344248.1 TrbC/VirB2 family protein [Salmonella enterica]EKV6319619.1 TrbC/VirB2 family protein [Escherichia coli]ELP9190333.1 TrbC/VirB2 family protein [Salmonella enterica]